MNEILGLLRHALTTGGGYLVANGMIGSSDMETLVGGLMAVLGVCWSLYDKRLSA